jgi:hypothetical protein
MSTDTPTEYESTELDERDVRALEQYLTVLDDTGRANAADSLYLVVSQSGAEYLVDTRAGRCECPDHEYRNIRCKHLRRVAFATGEESIPDGVEGVDPQLGEHVDGEPQAVATDGGRHTERVRVPVAGGVLVYESRPDEVGRELIGFEEVNDWAELRTALVARGIGVGAIHHKPVLDESARPEPRRSEPADFGGGESTGVQEL